MERKKASDFPQGLLDLFDAYVHGGISRRGFLDGAQKFAVGGLTAAALFDMLRPNYAWAVQVPPDDPPHHGAQRSASPSPNGTATISGYLVRPATRRASCRPSSSSTRTAASTLISRTSRGGWRWRTSSRFAPDGLTLRRRLSRRRRKRAGAFKTVDPDKMQADFLAAALWLKARPDCTGKLGAVGFCFGGGVVNKLAVAWAPTSPPPSRSTACSRRAADAAKIKAPINAQYAELDTRITGGWPAFDAALTAAGVPHEGHIYKGANHGFHNDTTPRYDEAAAKEAWGRTIDWLNSYLRG